MNPVQTVSEALAAADVEIIEAQGLALDAAAVRFSVRLTGRPLEGTIETIAIPSLVGRLGFEMLDVVVDRDAAVYVARRLPDLSPDHLGTYAGTCRALTTSGAWRTNPESAMVVGLLCEAVDDGRTTDATRHVMRLSRLTADAVRVGDLDLSDEERRLLLRPEAHRGSEDRLRAAA